MKIKRLKRVIIITLLIVKLINTSGDGICGARDSCLTIGTGAELNVTGASRQQCGCQRRGGVFIENSSSARAVEEDLVILSIGAGTVEPWEGLACAAFGANDIR